MTIHALDEFVCTLPYKTICLIYRKRTLYDAIGCKGDLYTLHSEACVEATAEDIASFHAHADTQAINKVLLQEKVYIKYAPPAHWIMRDSETVEISNDNVNPPAHYTSHPSSVECIQITEHMSFCIGNAVKYLWRADSKEDRLEDLRKAAWYIQREIELHTDE